MLKAILVSIPIIVALIFLNLKGIYLAGIIGFYLLPGICIAISRKRFPSREVLFSLIISIPFAIIVDFIGTASGLWMVPMTLFPRFLEILPLEDLIWMASAIFTSVMLGTLAYQLSDGEFFSKSFMVIIGFSCLILLLFFLLFFSYGKDMFVLNTPFLYIILGTLFFGLPTLFLTVHYRKSISRYLFGIAYFFLLTVVFESVAVTNAWWRFTGSYFLKPLLISGNVIPLEELFFVGIIGPIMAMLLYRFVFRKRAETYAEASAANQKVS